MLPQLHRLEHLALLQLRGAVVEQQRARHPLALEPEVLHGRLSLEGTELERARLLLRVVEELRRLGQARGKHVLHLAPDAAQGGHGVLHGGEIGSVLDACLVANAR